MIIDGLMEYNGVYILPTELDCHDVSSITGMSLKTYACDIDGSATSYTILTTTHPNWDSTNNYFKFENYSDGVWYFTLKVDYLDTLV